MFLLLWRKYIIGPIASSCDGPRRFPHYINIVIRIFLVVVTSGFETYFLFFYFPLVCDVSLYFLVGMAVPTAEYCRQFIKFTQMQKPHLIPHGSFSTVSSRLPLLTTSSLPLALHLYHNISPFFTGYVDMYCFKN